MDNLRAKAFKLARRQRRVRGKVHGTAARPRLRVTRSNTHIYAQIIDDVTGTTLTSASTLDADVRAAVGSGSNIAAAAAVGVVVGKRALERGVTEVVFDRGGRLYHGRVKALADGAREAGLTF
jgi:large subunit ribosomal protein L18